MLQFSKSQMVKKYRIYIPYQMRAALAFYSGAQIFISLPENNDAEILNQLVISPIPHSQQSDLWTLKTVFRDRPGIIAELSNLLRSENIDIIDFRSATRNQQQELVIHATLDAEFYSSDFDGDTGARRRNPRVWLQELHARILGEFIDDLSFRADGKANIFIIRNDVLRDSLARTSDRCSTTLSDGYIDIPQQAIEKVRDSFRKNYSIDHAPGKAASMVCSLCIDSAFRVLLATLYYKNSGHIHVRIKAKNEVGAIARFTKAISQAGLNILQTNARDINSSAVLDDFLLRLVPERDHFRDDKKLRAFVKGILADEGLSDLSPKVTFPPLMSSREIQNDKRASER